MSNTANPPTVALAARQRLLQALARRAQQHQGPARQLLDARLQQLQKLHQQPPHGANAAAQPGPEAPQPLRQLLAYIHAATARPSGPHDGTPLAARPATAPPAAAPELKAISQHRNTWSRLSAEQRLHQALAKVPSNAGPLNTQRLLHQALAAMRDASPQYLQHFMMQVETLLWLEQRGPGAPPAGDKKTSDPKTGPKKPGTRNKR